LSDLAYINGLFEPLESAKISINDRGLLFGDAVYEVVKAFGPCAFLLENHLERLRNGLDMLGIPAEELLQELPGIISQGIEMTKFKETLVYIQVSRGTQERSLIFKEGLIPNTFLTFRSVSSGGFQVMQDTGIAVVSRPDIRWTYCHIKSTNLLSNVLLRNDAVRHGAYEAILVNAKGNITEASSSSVFIVEDNSIITTPLSQHILPGVSRCLIVNDIAPSLGIPIREEDFSVERAIKAQEVFITATTIVLLPVTNIDNHVIGNGQPGPVAGTLLRAIQKEIANLGHS
jgi:D-alanine transaminase